MRTALRISLSAGLVAALFSFAPSSPAAPAACGATQSFDVYKIKLTPDREVYHLGDTAKVAVLVTDATTGAPASDAEVTVGAAQNGPRGYRYVNRAVMTDQDGEALAKLPLSRDAIDAGWAELSAFARTYYNREDTACAGVVLYGYERVKRAFRITD
jgi:5-hydroxyisourate hydrolase-like protein (transthyretin family)